MGRFTGILGLLSMLALAFIFSTNRRAIRLKTVAWGLGLQFVFAVFVLRIDAGRIAFQKAGNAVTTLLGYAYAGSHFVFGDLAKPGSQLGYFAFGVLPTVIFIAAFFAASGLYLYFRTAIAAMIASMLSRSFVLRAFAARLSAWEASKLTFIA